MPESADGCHGAPPLADGQKHPLTGKSPPAGLLFAFSQPRVSNMQLNKEEEADVVKTTGLSFNNFNKTHNNSKIRGTVQ